MKRGNADLHCTRTGANGKTQEKIVESGKWEVDRE
jgi:hypothetical protein